MKINIFITKAFTKNKNQGNPAGVVLDANSLSSEQMLYISNKLGFSESAFIQNSDKANFKIRFFSPTQEVSICAHATIAATYTFLKESNFLPNGKENLEVKVELESGDILPVSCYEDGLIVMQQKDPIFMKTEDNIDLIAKLLSINLQHIRTQIPIQVVSTGTPKLLIPVDSLDTLKDISPNLTGIKEYCQSSEARGFYPFTFQHLEEGSNLHARQFNPLAGIDEDPITGIAAGALGAYLLKYGAIQEKRIVVEQGYMMNKAGKIFVDLTNGVKVGGYAVVANIIELNL